MKATCLVTPPTAVLLIYGSIHPSLHSVTGHTLPPLWSTPAPRGVTVFHPDALQQPLHTHTVIISAGLCVGAEEEEEAVAAELQKFRLHRLIGAFPPPPPSPTTRARNKRRRRSFGASSAELEEKGEKERDDDRMLE